MSGKTYTLFPDGSWDPEEPPLIGRLVEATTAAAYKRAYESVETVRFEIAGLRSEAEALKAQRDDVARMLEAEVANVKRLEAALEGAKIDPASFLAFPTSKGNETQVHNAAIDRALRGEA